jgi:ribonuclease P protein component
MAAALGRLRTRSEFLRVAGARRKYVRPGLILQVLRRPATGRHGGDGEPTPRVGLTASRKVGTAVDRNRARRRLRAVVREVMADHAMPGHDYVIIARRGTLTRAYPALVRDLEAALKTLDAFRNGPGAAVEPDITPSTARAG